MESLIDFSKASTFVELNDQLKKLVDSLVPTTEYVEAGTQAVQNVFQLLQDNCDLHLDRIRVIGSIGKGTALPNSDFDSVVFVNRPILTLYNILDDFEQILRPLYPEMKKTKCSLQFTSEGFDIDILPAVNFLEETPTPEDIESHRLQADRVYEKILEAPPQNRGLKACSYNTSLCESQVNFMRYQSPFTHQLVRLAKAWNKGLFIEDYVSGRSTLFELVACHVANELEIENSGHPLILLIGFKKFIELICDFENLNIAFHDATTLTITEEMIPSKPYVLEPSNPFINMAKGDPRCFTESVVAKVKEYAAETLEKLLQTRSSNNNNELLDIEL